MMNDLSEMAALFTFFGLGVAYIWLSVVINRRQRAQRLVVEQLMDKYRGKVDQLAPAASRQDAGERGRTKAGWPMSQFYTGLLILLFALVVIWFVAAIARRQQAREAAAYESKRFNEIRA